jgi:hypothetical protein
VQQDTRDLDPPALAAAQLARFFAALLDKPDPFDLCRDPLRGIAMREAV